MICPYCNWRCADGDIEKLREHERKNHREELGEKFAVRCTVCGWTFYPNSKEWKQGYLEPECPNKECPNYGTNWRDTRKINSIWEEVYSKVEGAGR